MNFIKDLQESRMTRNSQDHSLLSYTDCCQRLYLSLLILEMLRIHKEYKKTAGSYARQTCSYDSYRYFRASATDLYNFIYFVDGDEKALSKLKDPEAAIDVRKKTHLPIMELNRYLTKVSHGQNPVHHQQTFLRIESALNISDSEYKSIRRGIFSFSDLSTLDKKRVATRLLLAARAKLRSSDIIYFYNKLVAEGNLETFSVDDTEPSLSTDDVSVPLSDIQLYRFIVGVDNLMLARRFIELAKRKKPIPSQMVEAYLPAIEMIDDLVQAGPSFIQMLKTLHKQARNQISKQ